MRHITTLTALLALAAGALADAPPPVPFEQVLNGKPEDVDLARLRGKVVLIDFFSKDCKPCIKAMPMLVEMQERWKDRFRIVGYHIGRGSPEEVAVVIRKMKLNYPVVMPPGWANPKVDVPGNDYLAKLGSEMLPAAAIVDAEGELRHKDLRPDAAHARVTEMLESTKRPSSPRKRGTRGRSGKHRP